MENQRTLRIGETDIVLRENQPPMIFHDFVTEHRHVDGMVYISLANITMDGKNQPEAEVVSRHRMSIVSAQILRNMLTEIIDAATKPTDQSKAN